MRKVFTIGLLLTLTSLTGCSISFEFYLRNFTEDYYVLKIFSNSTSRLTQMVPDYVLFKNRVLEMNKKTGRETTDSLATSMIGDTLIVKIPPKSTIMLPYFRTGYEEIRNFKVDGLLTNDLKTVDTFTVYPSLKGTGNVKRISGFFRVIDYYDIESNALY